MFKYLMIGVILLVVSLGCVRAEYNDKVSECNAICAECDEVLEDYNEAVDEYNILVEEYNLVLAGLLAVLSPSTAAEYLSKIQDAANEVNRLYAKWERLKTKHDKCLAELRILREQL